MKELLGMKMYFSNCVLTLYIDAVYIDTDACPIRLHCSHVLRLLVIAVLLNTSLIPIVFVPSKNLDSKRWVPG